MKIKLVSCCPTASRLPMVGNNTDHPVFCQPQAVRVLVAGRFQIGSSKAFNAMLDVEKKVCRADRSVTTPTASKKDPRA